MRKAKVMLSVLGVFAIVGGALAFKAQRDAFPFFTQVAGNCTAPANLLYTTNSAVANTTVTTTIRADIVSHTGICPALVVYSAD